MKRRDFGISAITAAAALAALPRSAKAAVPAGWSNVLFTEDNPGHWKGKEKTHTPVVTVAGGKISVNTPHPMTEEHFIVSHAVVLENGDYVDRKTFTWKDQPTSDHALPAGYKGNVIVISTCNQHDTWVKIVAV